MCNNAKVLYYAAVTVNLNNLKMQCYTYSCRIEMIREIGRILEIRNFIGALFC